MPIRRSIAYSTIASFGSQIISLALLVVTARWLFPAEIGAFAVAFSIIMVLEPLREFQLTTFIIQSKSIDLPTMRRVQSVGILAAAGGFVICNVAALILTAAFASPLPGDLLHLLSISFLIKPVAQPAIALLNREMRFGVLATIKLLAALLRLGTTIGLLLLGFGVEALVIGYLVEAACDLIAMKFVASPYRFPMPALSRSAAIWGFCLRLSGASFFNRASTSIGDLLVGSFLGLAAAGYYSRANSLVRTFRSSVDSAIVPIAVSAFSLADRTDRSATRTAYVNAMALLTGFSWPALGVLIVLAEPLIGVAYGPRWLSIVPVSQVLALGAIVYGATALAHVVLAAIGSADAILKRSVLIEVPRVVLMIGAVQISLMAVAWAFVVSMIVMLFVNYRVLAIHLNLGAKDMAASLWRSALVGFATVLCAYGGALLGKGASDAPAIILLAGLIAAGIGWLAAIVTFRHPFEKELGKGLAIVTGGLARRNSQR